MKKTSIYNLIILDESGSMSGIKSQTISGCNETLNTIRAAQQQFAETQEHYVSIFLFQSNDRVPSRYIIKNRPIGEVSDINAEQYQPWGCTPLYDAVGSTLVDLKATTKSQDLALGNVTIITDGMENSSNQYNRMQVANMIDALKEMGWSFNFIGANIDVQQAAHSLNIDNHMSFQQTDEGTELMFACERSSRMKWAERTNAILLDELSVDDDCSCESASASPKRSLFNRLKDSAKQYFDDVTDA